MNHLCLYSKLKCSTWEKLFKQVRSILYSIILYIKQILYLVTGDILPEKLGITLTHEHLSLQLEKFYINPPVQLEKHFNDGINNKIHLKNIGYIRQYPYSSKYNMELGYDEEQALIDDVMDFKAFGGDTIVENTNYGIERDLKFIFDVAKRTGVNVIAGTGHHIEAAQNSQTLNMSVEQLVDLYTKEIEEGIEVIAGTTVKCGFIGEVGSVYPMTSFEKKTIQATGMVQDDLKCGVSFHPGFNPQAPFEIIRVYLEAGGNANKCVMSHLDLAFSNIDDLLEFSNLDCFNQMDLFGMEVSWYQHDPQIDIPSDAQRLERLKVLADEGKIDKILMSQDIHTKHRLVRCCIL